jgi:hypothetical protein
VQQPNKKCHLLIIAALLLTTLAGCASITPARTEKAKPVVQAPIPDANNWWGAGFRIGWPEDAEPQWHMDLFIAHEIIKPVMEKYEADIILWRFHRRAARDSAGHRFSYIFYASPQTADRIYTEIGSSELLDGLKTAGLVELVSFDDITKPAKPDIEDSSDKNWSLPIQRTWPYFIMGASQMWLQLTGDVAADISKDNQPATVSELEAIYKKTNAVVTQMWQKEGRHAFLHHLNAIFEYKPVVVWEKRLLKF